MNIEIDGLTGLRRAALAMHALGTTDRDWLLQQLAAPQRESLISLLAELQELRIPPDTEVIRIALREAAANTLSNGDAVSLCLALERESPAVQSVLLAALDAPEREAVLEHWQAEFHARPSAISAPAWTPALRRAVQESWREVAQGIEK